MQLSSRQTLTTAVLALAVLVTTRSWEDQHNRQHAMLAANVAEFGSQKMLREVEMDAYKHNFFRCGQRAGGRVDTDHKDAFYSVYELSGNELVNGNLDKRQPFDGKMYASQSYTEEDGFELPTDTELQRFSPNTWYYQLSSHRTAVSCSNGVRVTETEEEAREEGRRIQRQLESGGIPSGGGGSTGVSFGGTHGYGGSTGVDFSVGGGATGVDFSSGGGSTGVSWGGSNGGATGVSWGGGTGNPSAGGTNGNNPFSGGQQGQGSWPRGSGRGGVSEWPSGVGKSGDGGGLGAPWRGGPLQ